MIFPPVLILKRKIVGSFILLSVLAAAAQSQSIREDSVRSALTHTKDDLPRARALLALSELLKHNDPRTAMAHGHQALLLARTKKFLKEESQACNMLGGILHMQSSYDSSLYYYRLALQLSLNNHERAEAIRALMGMSENFMRQNKTDSSRFHLQQALELAVQLKEPTQEAGIYNNLGNVYLEEHHLTEALEQFIHAATIFEKTNPNESGLGKAWVNIGNIELIQGHPDKALNYTLRSLAIFKKNGMNFDLAYCYKLLGRIYRKQGELDKALITYGDALSVYIQLGDRRNASEVFHSRGNVYYDQKKFKKALEEYEKGLAGAKQIQDKIQMAYAYSAIGYAWYELRNPSKSVAYFDSSMVNARLTKNRYLVMDAYEVLSQLHEEQNNLKEALRFHRAFSEQRDSLNRERNDQATEELESKYQNEKKQAEIELLQKDQQLKTTTLRQQRVIQTALIAAILLIIVVSLLLFNRYRFMQNARRLTEGQHIRNQIARDLHDDIGSTLSSINIICQVAIKENKSESFRLYFQRIGEQSAKMMERMSDMVWSINPENDSLDKMIVRMKEFLTEILESTNIGFELNGEQTLKNRNISLEQRKSLFLIFKEAINNAVKYSEASMITIDLVTEQDRLLMTIRDNGKGFDLAQVKKGNGLRNMKERAKEIDGILDLTSNIESGTTLHLSLPLHHHAIL